MLFQRVAAPQRGFQLPLRTFNPSSSILFPSSHATARPPSHNPVRHATHAAQGRANVQNKSHGKRLGAKKTGEQYVIPGNIIYRQRGTLWHEGVNTARGKDHTIYATQAGYVKYYRDPRLHAKRQYIGVTFNRDDTLPYPINAARKRRFGMVASLRPNLRSPAEAPAMEQDIEGGEVGIIPNPNTHGIAVAQAESSPSNADRKRTATGRIDASALPMQAHYGYRESNYSIGRIADRAGVTVSTFRPGNRWAAWRRREKKTTKYKERRVTAKAAKGGKKRAGKRR